MSHLLEALAAHCEDPVMLASCQCGGLHGRLHGCQHLHFRGELPRSRLRLDAEPNGRDALTLEGAAKALPPLL